MNNKTRLGESLIRFFVDRYNSRDLLGSLELCAPDVVLEDKFFRKFEAGTC